MPYESKGPSNSLVPVLISWVLFTVMYWVAATHKPFHVDEFYSWVYAERASWKEILLLKDFGIGHPPLYHLIQKLVQLAMPGHHPAYVRTANYVLGSAFVFLLARILTRKGKRPLFSYGVCSSAAILDAFVFSRMWGALCLVSLLLYAAGEDYLAGPSQKKRVVFLLLVVLGVITDYAFIIVLPYAGLVWVSKKRYGPWVPHVLLSVLLTAWILGEWVKSPNGMWIGYVVASHLSTIALETWFMLLGYRFQEPFLIALLSVVLIFWLSWRKRQTEEQEQTVQSGLAFMISGGILAVMGILLRNDILQARYIAIAFVLMLAGAIWNLVGLDKDAASSENFRLIMAVACGLLVVLLVNPFFWRDLLRKRFLIPLAPFLVVLTYRNLNPCVVSTMSAVLFFSGLLYVSSSFIDNLYSTASWTGGTANVYEDEFAYADYYLRNEPKTTRQPYFLYKNFTRNCRICSMGTSDIPFHSWGTVVIIARKDPRSHLPRNFEPVDVRKTDMSYTDRYQLEHFHPLRGASVGHKVYTYRKIDEAGE